MGYAQVLFYTENRSSKLPYIQLRSSTPNKANTNAPLMKLHFFFSFYKVGKSQVWLINSSHGKNKTPEPKLHLNVYR